MDAESRSQLRRRAGLTLFELHSTSREEQRYAFCSGSAGRSSWNLISKELLALSGQN